MTRLSRLLLTLACACGGTAPQQAAPDPTPQSACGATCSSSLECRDFFGGCRFCSFGKCSATLPADPTTLDAGVDAQ